LRADSIATLSSDVTQDQLLVAVSVVGQTASLLGSERVLQVLLDSNRLENHRHVEWNLGQIHGEDLRWMWEVERETANGERFLWSESSR
jgi:hypothetical protein